MALEFHSGFETGDLGEYAYVYGAVSVVGTHPNTGSYEMRCNPSGSVAYIRVKVENTGKVSANMYIASAPDAEAIIIGSEGGGYAAVRLTPDRHLKLYLSGVEKDVGETQLDTGKYYRISICISDDNSEAKIFLNGVEECADAGGGWTSIASFLGVENSGVNADLYFDDIVMDDVVSVTDLDDIRTIAARPNAEGTWQETGTGEKWQDSDNTPAVFTEIDNDPANDTDYNWCEADGGTWHYTVGLQSLADIGISGVDIQAVRFMWYYETLGGGLDYATMMRDQGVDTEDWTIDDPKVPTWLSSYELDCPSDGDPWSEGVFDATEMGMACKDSGKDLWFYEAYAMIAFIPSVGPPAGFAYSQAIIIA